MQWHLALANSAFLIYIVLLNEAKVGVLSIDTHPKMLYQARSVKFHYFFLSSFLDLPISKFSFQLNSRKSGLAILFFIALTNFHSNAILSL